MKSGGVRRLVLRWHHHRAEEREADLSAVCLAEEGEGEEGEEDGAEHESWRFVASGSQLAASCKLQAAISQALQNRAEQILRHARRPQRLPRLHRAVIVRAAGEHLAAEARHLRVCLARGVID